MKKPRILVILTGIVLLIATVGCSDVTPAEVTPTANIDATVAARAKELVAAQPTPPPMVVVKEVTPTSNIDAMVEARAKELVAAQPTPTPVVVVKEVTPKPATEPTIASAPTDTSVPTTTPVRTNVPVPTATPSPDIGIPTIAVQQPEETFTIDVWADNWFALYINSEKIGEDSVPITTERSFNKETFTFTATRPLTIGIEGKDFKETDSGIEYIGERNQQMGDGGLIAQVRDSKGDIVTVTDDTWSAFVVHKAPLDKSCERSSDPDVDCEFKIADIPGSWYTSVYDSTAWDSATEHNKSAVSPKDGYYEVSWDTNAQFIWGNDLEQDNTILFKTTVQ